MRVLICSTVTRFASPAFLSLSPYERGRLFMSNDMHCMTAGAIEKVK